MKHFEMSDRHLLKNVTTIFTDIDDTITLNGKLLDVSYSAMWKAYHHGLRIIPVTGRPAGWVDHIARMWPVFAVVGENGAFYNMMKNGKLMRFHSADATTYLTNKTKLKAIQDEILSTVHGTALSSDQNYRDYDLAIDYCEDVSRLSEADVDRIVSIFTKHGATAKVSSIHVNGWFGNYDKLSMVKTLVAQELNGEFESLNNTFVFVGDSPNDEPMFGAFTYSFGVSNIQEFIHRMTATPTFTVDNPGGYGFSDVIDHIIESKK